jgi:hypothetical protein
LATCVIRVLYIGTLYTCVTRVLYIGTLATFVIRFYILVLWPHVL